jgi:hypothetical protein
MEPHIVIARGSMAIVLVQLLSGCSAGSKPYQTAPVAGLITLDGKPLAGAHVTFMPVPEAQSGRQSGPEASGDTADNGRYSLKTAFGDAGASVGKNRVMITTRKTELDPTNPDRSKEVAKEQVPGKYFTDQSPIYCDVSAGGTTAADFKLTTR